jgi:hypothetical protein
MKWVKLFAVAITLALASFVYAAGNVQESKMACHMDKAGCCAAECCKNEGSCCKMDKTMRMQATAQTTEGDKAEASCASGQCCKDGENCCKADNSGKTAASSCCAGKDGKSCCADGKGCCSGGGGECCKQEKTRTS